MYDHIGLKTQDLDASDRFYRAALAPLGAACCYEDESTRGYGAGSAVLYLSRGAPGQGVHLAFTAVDRVAVDRFHAAGIGAGGSDNGAPGLRPDYHPTYYAAYLLDPDGNNVEAVCHQ